MGRDPSPLIPSSQVLRFRLLGTLGWAGSQRGLAWSCLEGAPILVQASRYCGQAVASTKPQALTIKNTNKKNNCSWLSLHPSGGQVLLS